jgi:hypothetical protein
MVPAYRWSQFELLLNLRPRKVHVWDLLREMPHAVRTTVVSRRLAEPHEPQATVLLMGPVDPTTAARVR